MTITISPRTEAMLREEASRTGQDADILADALLAETLEEQARDFEEAVTGIAEGIADGEAGREISLEEYKAQFEAEREVRRQRREQGAKAA